MVAALVFVCVDPEGLEIQIETIKAVVQRAPASDLFINYSAGVERVRAEAEAHGKGVEVLEQFAGTTLDQIRDAVGVDGSVLDVYEKSMDAELGKPLGASTRVLSNAGNPRYHLLIRTRRTVRGSPYHAGYEALVKRMSGVTADDARTALGIVAGRQSQL